MYLGKKEKSRTGLELCVAAWWELREGAGSRLQAAGASGRICLHCNAVCLHCTELFCSLFVSFKNCFLACSHAASQLLDSARWTISPNAVLKQIPSMER